MLLTLLVNSFPMSAKMDFSTQRRCIQRPRLFKRKGCKGYVVKLKDIKIYVASVSPCDFSFWISQEFRDVCRLSSESLTYPLRWCMPELRSNLNGQKENFQFPLYIIYMKGTARFCVFFGCHGCDSVRFLCLLVSAKTEIRRILRFKWCTKMPLWAKYYALLWLF